MVPRRGVSQTRVKSSGQYSDKSFMSVYRKQRLLSLPTTSCVSPLSSSTNRQPTYRLQPEAKHRFHVGEVERIISQTLDSYLSDYRKYDAERFPALGKTLSDVIKDRVKGLELPRYKLISHVTVMETKKQDTIVASRFIWDAGFDNFACVRYKGVDYQVVANVYALYTN